MIWFRAIDEKVRDIVKGAPQEWTERVEQDLGVKIDELAPDWGQICEVFARRNTIVHAGGRIDEAYIKRTGANDLSVGEVLDTNAKYFTETATAFRALAVRLAVACFARLVPQGPAPGSFAKPHIYVCLKRKDWQGARVLATAVVSGREQGELPGEVLVNWWMARREAGEGVENSGRSDLMGPNTEGPGFALARMALLMDDAGFRRVLKERGSEITPRVGDWPLVSKMFEISPDLRGLFATPVSHRRTASHTPRPRKKAANGADYFSQATRGLSARGAQRRRGR